MQLAALQRGERVVCGSAQQRLGVGQRRVIAQDACAHESLGGSPRVVVLDRGPRGRLDDRRVAQHRHGVREPLHGLRMAAEARDDVASYRLRRDRRDRVAAAGTRGHVTQTHARCKLADQERLTASSRVNHIHDFIVDVIPAAANLPREDMANAIAAETRGTEKERVWFRRERLQPTRAHSGLAAPPRRDHQHRQARRAVTQEAQEVQGGADRTTAGRRRRQLAA